MGVAAQPFFFLCSRFKELNIVILLNIALLINNGGILLKKGLIDTFIIVFIILGSVLFFVKANVPVAVENLLVEKSNTINERQNENYLDLIKSPLIPT
jgi:hypothetical protein